MHSKIKRILYQILKIDAILKNKLNSQIKENAEKNFHGL